MLLSPSANKMLLIANQAYLSFMEQPAAICFSEFLTASKNLQIQVLNLEFATDQF